MRGVICVGDKTSHGGVVLTGSAGLTFMGRAAACKGDAVSCPLHGDTTIIEGDAGSMLNGREMALHGHRCGCGCTLVASITQAGKV